MDKATERINIRVKRTEGQNPPTAAYIHLADLSADENREHGGRGHLGRNGRQGPRLRTGMGPGRQLSRIKVKQKERLLSAISQ